MISFIVARSKNNVIGCKNQLPWHLPNDLQFFKKVTMGHPIVMGRKTFESIGKPLPGRRNIVLTRDPDFQAEGVEVVHDKATICQLAEEEEVFLIGGAQIFSLFMDVVENIYITEIDAEFIGDTFFPPWDREQFDCVCQLKGEVDEKNLYPHTFYIYQRKP